MGLDSDVTGFLRFRYKAAWIKTRESTEHKPEVYTKSATTVPGRRPAYYPTDANVAIFDATSKLKVFQNDIIGNGLDFVNKHLLYDAITFLGTETQTEAFFLCFDRGSPANKDSTHRKRYSDIVPVNIDTIPDSKVFINTENIVNNQTEWKQFINNNILRQEALYFITKTLVNPTTPDNFYGCVDKNNVYTPPPNKMLFLFGGIIDPPNRERAKREKRKPDPYLFYVGNEEGTSEDNSYLNKTKTYNRVSGIYEQSQNSHIPYSLAFKVEDQEKLLEGEVSTMYFSKVYSYTGKNILLISGDGDMIIHALLACKDRIDSNGNFINKVYLRLHYNSVYEDIDINFLYKLMCDDKIFLSHGIKDPAIFIAIGALLVKNDYFDGYCKGIGTINPKKDEKCPYIMYTILSMIKNYKFMVTIPTESSIRESLTYPKLQVVIDEGIFTKFTHDCYVIKYMPQKENSQDADFDKKRRPSEKPKKKGRGKKAEIDTMNIEHSDITNYEVNAVKAKTSKLANQDYRIPSDEKIRVHARMLEWVLTYFYNAYRGDCIVPSPMSVYKGSPYYGWVISFNENACVQGVYVTKEKRPTLDCSWYRGPLQEFLIIEENGIIKMLTGSDAEKLKNEIRKRKLLLKEPMENPNIHSLLIPKQISPLSHASTRKPQQEYTRLQPHVNLKQVTTIKKS